MNGSRPLAFVAGVALLGLGGTLVARAVSHDGDDDAPGFGEHNRNASVPYHHGSRVEKTFTIARPAAELYAYWRDFANLPSIMSHLQSVEVVDAKRSHWIAKGPGGTTASWDAEIVNDVPDELIAWRSVGGNVPNAGSVAFAPAGRDRGTELRVEMEWAPPGGPLTSSFVNVLGGDPGLMVETELRRFKAKMETGSVAVNGTDVKS